MLKNYFIVAIRHLTRHRLFSLINICCLAIGITFSMLIGIYILNQWNVNHNLKNYEQQYVIKSKWKIKDMGLPITTMGPLAKALKEEYPNLVANYFRYNPVTNVVSNGDKHFKEDIAICDTSLVSMYGFKLLYGDKNKVFKNSSSAVITEGMAIKLFGTTNALNKTITISTIGNGKQDYMISGILKSIPYNSVTSLVDTDGYGVFLPFEGCRYYPNTAGENDWNQIFMVGMIELKKGVSVQDVNKAASKLLATNLPNNLKGLLEPEFVSVKDYYLNDNNGAVNKMINTLSLIALFILMMAVINFVNINIGTSSYRLKEIGLRKVFGSARTQLVLQHLTESFVLTVVAGLISLCFYELVRPYFNQVLNTTLDSIFQFHIGKIFLLMLLLIVIGFISGIYPAFVLSASHIISSVKGKIDSSIGNLLLRKGLLVIQFSLAIVVFIGALNVSRQVSYFFNKNIGYNKDQVLVISAFPKQWDSAGVLKMESVRNGMAALPNVQSASLSYEVPDRMPPGTIDLLPNKSNQAVVVRSIVADENFAKTFEIKTKRGDFFNDYSRSSPKNEIVLNETAAKELGVTIINQIIKTRTGSTFTIAGIVNDFNYSSFQQTVGPLAFLHIRDNPTYRYLSVKIGSQNIEKTIASIKQKWKELLPNSPFEYNFMDERFKSLYKSEMQLKTATLLATVLNMLIVFMGIFGVVAFTLARRNKEIAVRKVLGAEAKNIIVLFLKDYAWLILVSNIIAWPLAYWATDQWLHNYAYRIQQNIFPYLLVLMFVVLSVFLFITVQCFKVANTNPVKSLRTE